MAERQWFAEGVQVFDEGEEEFFVEGVQLCEDQADVAPPATRRGDLLLSGGRLQRGGILTGGSMVA